MADLKLTELPGGNPLTGAELLYIVQLQAGIPTSVKGTVAELAAGINIKNLAGAPAGTGYTHVTNGVYDIPNNKLLAIEGYDSSLFLKSTNLADTGGFSLVNQNGGDALHIGTVSAPPNTWDGQVGVWLYRSGLFSFQGPANSVFQLGSPTGGELRFQDIDEAVDFKLARMRYDARALKLEFLNDAGSGLVGTSLVANRETRHHLVWNGTVPEFHLNDVSKAANKRLWRLQNIGENASLIASDDAITVNHATFDFYRNGRFVAGMGSIRSVGSLDAGVNESQMALYGGFGSPIAGRIGIGDGSGWKAHMSVRVGGAWYDRFTFNDNGNFESYGSATINGNIYTNALNGGTLTVTGLARATEFLAEGNASVIRMRDPGSPTDQKNWRFVNYNNGQIRLELMNDANSSAMGWSWIASNGALRVVSLQSDLSVACNGLNNTGRTILSGGTTGNYTQGPLEIAMTGTPRVSFHWPGQVAAQIGMDISGLVRTFNANGDGYANFGCGNLYSGGTQQFASVLSITGDNATNPGRPWFRGNGTNHLVINTIPGGVLYLNLDAHGQNNATALSVHGNTTFNQTLSVQGLLSAVGGISNLPNSGQVMSAEWTPIDVGSNGGVSGANYYQARYMRVNAAWTMSGQVDGNPTGGGAVAWFRCYLPSYSVFGFLNRTGVGIITNAFGDVGYCNVVAGNGHVDMLIKCTNGGVQGFFFHLTWSAG